MRLQAARGARASCGRGRALHQSRRHALVTADKSDANLAATTSQSNSRGLRRFLLRVRVGEQAFDSPPEPPVALLPPTTQTESFYVTLLFSIKSAALVLPCPTHSIDAYPTLSTLGVNVHGPEIEFGGPQHRPSPVARRAPSHTHILNTPLYNSAQCAATGGPSRRRPAGQGGASGASWTPLWPRWPQKRSRRLSRRSGDDRPAAIAGQPKVRGVCVMGCWGVWGRCVRGQTGWTVDAAAAARPPGRPREVFGCIVRLWTLCTHQQRCILPLHTIVRCDMSLPCQRYVRPAPGPSSEGRVLCVGSDLGSGLCIYVL